MEYLKRYYNIVEECIVRLGVDPNTCREPDKEGQWTLRKGSAQVWVDVFHSERENRAYYQVMSPIMTLPEKSQCEFYREVLEINDQLFGVAFTIYKDRLWLKVIREADGLDVDEAFNMLTRIGNYGDKYDDILIQKYSDAQSVRGDESIAPGPPPSQN